MYDTTKLRSVFPSTTIYKDQDLMSMFRSAKIEAFLRDWIIKRKANAEGRISDQEQLRQYVASIIPQQSEAAIIQEEARSGEARPFLAKVNILFNSKAGNYSFEISELGFNYSNTIIEDYVWERIKDQLINDSGGWGLITVGYQPPEGNRNNGRFTLLSYKNFCPYKVNLDAWREARKQFDDPQEWMDILLGAIDYNPDGFALAMPDKTPESVWLAKHTMLTRLLPFIQPRVNLFELAPQQTGKSYIFGKLGKYGWLAGGGSISRAKLFLDMGHGSTKKGLVTFNDFVAIDEVKSISFTNDKEMAGILKGYMEDGYVNVGNEKVSGEAGIIFLGNIRMEDMNGDNDMFRDLPPVFRDTALIERIHGFIPATNIPPLSTQMFISGWALNTEYFTEIMHLFRSPAENMRYRDLVNKLVCISSKNGATSKREEEAVKRLCTAYIKLFFPHANEDLIQDLQFKKQFNEYCLQPAVRMQSTVIQQMKIINPDEFRNRFISTYSVE